MGVGKRFLSNVQGPHEILNIPDANKNIPFEAK